jgi:hypothetical protein
LSGVRVALHSTLYLLFGLCINFVYDIETPKSRFTTGVRVKESVTGAKTGLNL